MRNHYLATLFFLAILPVSVNAQKSISWGPEISVADGNVYGNVRPRIALTTNDQPIVLWGHSGDGVLNIVKGDGNTFATPVTITPAGVETYLAYWTGPDVAAHGDTVIAVFKALPFDGGKIYAVRSTDGGLTFSDTIRVDDHTTGRVFLPSLDLDNNGNPTAIYMAFEGSNADPRYVATRSLDGGLTFETGSEIASSNAAEACDCCPGEVVIDGNRQIVLYRNNLQNIRDIYGSLSTDGGQTFAAATNMEYLNWNINSCPSTGPHGLAMGDSLIVVSASQASGAYRVYVSVASWDNGLTFQHQTELLPPINVNGKQNYPRISGENDTIIVVWEERETSNPEIFCSVVTNGNTNDLAVYKSRVNTVTSGVQTNPDIVYRNGFAHVVYSDAASGDVIYRRGTIIDVTGVEENSLLQIQAFPNPSAAGRYNLIGIPDGNWKAVVTDLSGKVIGSTLNSTAGGYELMLIETANEGVYFVQLQNESGSRLTVQLVKTKGEF